MTTGQRIDVAITLFVRLFLAGVFGFAAYMKLQSNDAAQAFAESIRAFDVLSKIDHEHLVVISTFLVPWAEAICAVLILLGLWTRAASFVMLSAVGVFIAAIYSVIARELDVKCGCFGEFSFPCGDVVGPCHIWRNGVLAAGCLFLVIRGGGRLSFDRLWCRPRARPSTSRPAPPPARTGPPSGPIWPAPEEKAIPLDPARPAPLSSPPTGQPPADKPPKPRWD
jgi:uncharacterized membrane protein YphA (DoxX/SURF4 family)